MEPENRIKCPECSSISCVVGEADTRDSQFDDKYYFYPKNITQKSFLKFINKRVDIENNGELYACYKCGYLWGKVDATKLSSVLKKLEWDGELQEEPKTRFTLPKITEWALITVVILLLLFIIYVYYKT